jgi:hypothetical protein
VLALEDAARAVEQKGAALLARVLGPASMIAVALAQLACAPARTINGPLGLRADERPMPYDTLRTLRELPVHRLYNDFPIGGFLIWQDGPWGVFCDGRTVSLYGEEDVQRLFVPMMSGTTAMTKSADEWDAPYGLNQSYSPPFHSMMVSREWVPVHLGLGTSLFVRTTRLGELPPGVRPLHLVRHSGDARWNQGFFAGIVKDQALRAQLLEEMAAAAARGPESPVLVDIARTVSELDPGLGGKLAATIAAARSR